MKWSDRSNVRKRVTKAFEKCVRIGIKTGLEETPHRIGVLRGIVREVQIGRLDGCSRRCVKPAYGAKDETEKPGFVHDDKEREGQNESERATQEVTIMNLFFCRCLLYSVVAYRRS